MIRKNLMKSLSVIMAAMMAIMTVACGSNTVDTTAETAVEMAAEEEAGEDPLANTVVGASNIASAESEAGKVETVYVTADANGAVNDVIVSEWLKNAAASPEIADTTELKDIVNVKGDETFTDNGDGTLTWNAAGSDIYYQGTTDKQLPVTMKITYTLDGKEISPEELAGKSGKVTIRFEYENNDRQTVEVNGKEVDVYTPFAMVSGMMLDSDKFTNVEISNGKVISDGGNIIVMGVALPGLKESLDISDDKWDELEDADEIKDKLSNSFEITADTTDFELGMTITMASSDILSDFGMTDLSNSDKLDDLKSDMEDLNDGSNKLVDGTKELKDGTKEFADGTKKLYDGATELKDGTQKLYDGTGSLVDGTGKLFDGAGQLHDGTSTLKDGTGKLYDGVKAYTDGVSQVNSGASELAKGAAAAQKGSTDLKNGIAQVQGGAKQISDGAPTLQAGVKKLTGTVRNMIGMLGQMNLNELSTNKTLFTDTYKYLEGKGEYNQNVHDLVFKLSGGQITDKETLDACRDAYNTTQVAPEGNGAEDELDLGDDVKTGTVEKPNTDEEKETGDRAAEDTSNESSGDGNASGGSGNAAPANGDGTPVNGDGTPVNGDGTPVNGDGTPVNGDETPANSGETPANGDGTPVNSDETPANNGETPANNGGTPVNEDEEGTDGRTVTFSVKSESIEQSVDDGDQLGALLLQNKSVKGAPGLLGASGDEKIYTQKDYDDAIAKARQETAQETAAKYTAAINAYELGIKKLKYAQVYTAVQTGYSMLSKIDVNSLSQFADAKKIIEINTQLDALDAGVDKLAGGSSQLTDGLTKVYDGSGALEQGIGKLSAGAKQLADGTGTLASKSGDLVDGVSQLNDGAGKLNDGAGELADGAGKLNDGAVELRDGAGKLNDGTGELKDGTKELYDGSIELDNGVKELLDGVTKFDEEGIKKIYEAFDGDLSDFTDRLEAIKEAGNSYKTFGGSAEEVDSSVKFIIKTDSIKSL